MPLHPPSGGLRRPVSDQRAGAGHRGVRRARGRYVVHGCIDVYGIGIYTSHRRGRRLLSPYMSYGGSFCPHHTHTHPQSSSSPCPSRSSSSTSTSGTRPVVGASRLFQAASYTYYIRTPHTPRHATASTRRWRRTRWRRPSCSRRSRRSGRRRGRRAVSTHL